MIDLIRFLGILAALYAGYFVLVMVLQHALARPPFRCTWGERLQIDLDRRAQRRARSPR